MFYLMTHSTHLITIIWKERFLFNNALFLFMDIWKEGRKERFYLMMHSTHFI